MSIQPLPPRCSNVIGSPFDPHLTRFPFLLCHLESEIRIITHRVVRLPIPAKVLYQQVFELNIAFTQLILMPDRKISLLKRSLCRLIQIVIPSSSVWINEAAYYVVMWYWH